MPLSVGLLGTGRLGAAVRAAAAPRDDVEIVWAVGRGAELERLPPVDVAIDVSSADAVPEHLTWARRTGTPVVVGTTGWDPVLVPDDVDVPVLLAPNFSLGVALVEQLARVLGRYAAHAPSPVDLAVTDTHHRHKVDAPSGTAIVLRDALVTGVREGRGVDAGDGPDHDHDPDDDPGPGSPETGTPAPTHTVQTTSLRVGEVVGRHEVVAASALETITLTHEAHDRAVFATGALTAARWLVGRPAGRWSMADLAAEQLGDLAGSSGSTAPRASGSDPDPGRARGIPPTPSTPGAPAPHAAA